jgi:hypothetical protein
MRDVPTYLPVQSSNSVYTCTGCPLLGFMSLTCMSDGLMQRRYWLPAMRTLALYVQARRGGARCGRAGYMMPPMMLARGLVSCRSSRTVTTLVNSV